MLNSYKLLDSVKLKTDPQHNNSPSAFHLLAIGFWTSAPDNGLNYQR